MRGSGRQAGKQASRLRARKPLLEGGAVCAYGGMQPLTVFLPGPETLRGKCDFGTLESPQRIRAHGATTWAYIVIKKAFYSVADK